MLAEGFNGINQRLSEQAIHDPVIINVVAWRSSIISNSLAGQPRTVSQPFLDNQPRFRPLAVLPCAGGEAIQTRAQDSRGIDLSLLPGQRGELRRAQQLSNPEDRIWNALKGVRELGVRRCWSGLSSLCRLRRCCWCIVVVVVHVRLQFRNLGPDASRLDEHLVGKPLISCQTTANLISSFTYLDVLPVGHVMAQQEDDQLGQLSPTQHKRVLCQLVARVLERVAHGKHKLVATGRPWNLLDRSDDISCLHSWPERAEWTPLQATPFPFGKSRNPPLSTPLVLPSQNSRVKSGAGVRRTRIQ